MYLLFCSVVMLVCSGKHRHAVTVHCVSKSYTCTCIMGSHSFKAVLSCKMQNYLVSISVSANLLFLCLLQSLKTLAAWPHITIFCIIRNKILQQNGYFIFCSRFPKMIYTFLGLLSWWLKVKPKVL